MNLSSAFLIDIQVLLHEVFLPFLLFRFLSAVVAVEDMQRAQSPCAPDHPPGCRDEEAKSATRDFFRFVPTRLLTKSSPFISVSLLLTGC